MQVSVIPYIGGYNFNDRSRSNSGADKWQRNFLHNDGRARKNIEFSDSEMKQVMMSGSYSKWGSGSAWLYYEWGWYSNRSVRWDRYCVGHSVEHRAEVQESETVYVDGITKPKTPKREMKYTHIGWGGCGYGHYRPVYFSFVITGDPVPVYAVESSNE